MSVTCLLKVWIESKLSSVDQFSKEAAIFVSTEMQITMHLSENGGHAQDKWGGGGWSVYEKVWTASVQTNLNCWVIVSPYHGTLEQFTWKVLKNIHN